MKARTWISLISIFILGLYFKKTLFPSEEVRINSQLGSIAQLASDISSNTKATGIIQLASQINELTKYFTFPFKIDHQQRRSIRRTLTIADKVGLKERLFAIRSAGRLGRVSFPNNIIVVSKNTATSTGPLRIDFQSSDKRSVYDVYETVIDWKKAKDEWLIQSIKIDIKEL